MSVLTYDRFKHMSGKRTSPQRQLFLDMVNNPQNYKGYIVYLKEIDDDEIYQPFDHTGTFYVNEGGVWLTTDFHEQALEE